MSRELVLTIREDVWKNEEHMHKLKQVLHLLEGVESVFNNVGEYSMSMCIHKDTLSCVMADRFEEMCKEKIARSICDQLVNDSAIKYNKREEGDISIIEGRVRVVFPYNKQFNPDGQNQSKQPE